MQRHFETLKQLWLGPSPLEHHFKEEVGLGLSLSPSPSSLHKGDAC